MSVQENAYFSIIFHCFIKYQMNVDSSIFTTSVQCQAGVVLCEAPGEAVVCGQAAFDFYCAELE